MSLHNQLLDAAVETFRVPPGASSAQVRKSGCLTVLMGMAASLAAIGAMILAARGGASDGNSVRMTMPFMVLACAAISVGGYRFVLGAEPDGGGAGRALLRILVGVASVVVAAFLILIIVIVIGGVFGLF